MMDNSELFNILGWRKDNEVKLNSSILLDCEEIYTIAKLFNTYPFNSDCTGRQFILSFVLYHEGYVYYHPHLHNPEYYYAEQIFECCSLDYFKSDILPNFKQENWSVR